MNLNHTHLGTLDKWYNSGHVCAFGYLDGAKTPIRTDWTVKIDRPNKRLYVKNGYYDITNEIWDDNQARRLYGHLTLANKGLADTIARIKAVRERNGI